MSFYDQGDKYAPVTEGNYIAKLFSITPDFTKADPKISLQWQLDNNRRVFQNFTVSEKGKKFLTWQFSSLGSLDKAKTLVKDPATATATDVAKSYVDASADLIGKMFDISIAHRTWEGKTYENVTINHAITDTTVAKSTGVKNHAPTFNDKEELPF